MTLTSQILLQLALAGLSFASTYTYAAYFALRRRAAIGPAPWHLPLLMLVVDIPLERVWWVMPFLPQPRFAPELPLRLLGCAAICAGIWHYVFYVRENAPATKADYAAPVRLVDTGIYARVRHPGAVGSVAIVAGLCLVTGARATSLLWVVFAAIVHRVARIEETRVLAARFGASYETYAARVPRYLTAWRAPAALVLAAALAVTAGGIGLSCGKRTAGSAAPERATP